MLIGRLFDFYQIKIPIMKRVILIMALGFFFAACNPNQNNTEETMVDSTRNIDSANAGLTGTTNANGFIPADSNKSINAPIDTSVNAEHLSPPNTKDSTK